MADVLWKVTGITDVVMYDPGKGPVAAKRIDFTIVDGSPSYITVNIDEFNRDVVAKKIQMAAEHMIEVLSLQGPEMLLPGEIPTEPQF